MQAWDRFAYSYGNPVKYIDPDGHDPIPYDEFITQAYNYFTGLGMELVGTLQGVKDKGINTNGADMVFKYVANEIKQVVGVELKNIGSNSVNLGTLGKAVSGYGGSISRLFKSAGRFLNLPIASLHKKVKQSGKPIVPAICRMLSIRMLKMSPMGLQICSITYTQAPGIILRIL